MLIAEHAPKGIMTSGAFEVTLTQGEICQRSDVYLTVCPSTDCHHDYLPQELCAEFNGISDGGPTTIYLERAYFTGFTTDKETLVKVKICQEFDKLMLSARNTRSRAMK